MLENPVSTLSTYWRAPDWKFDPYQYDDYPSLIKHGDVLATVTALDVVNDEQ